MELGGQQPNGAQARHTHPSQTTSPPPSSGPAPSGGYTGMNFNQTNLSSSVSGVVNSIVGAISNLPSTLRPQRPELRRRESKTAQFLSMLFGMTDSNTSQNGEHEFPRMETNDRSEDLAPTESIDLKRTITPHPSPSSSVSTASSAGSSNLALGIKSQDVEAADTTELIVAIDDQVSGVQGGDKDAGSVGNILDLDEDQKMDGLSGAEE